MYDIFCACMYIIYVCTHTYMNVLDVKAEEEGAEGMCMCVYDIFCVHVRILTTSLSLKF